ncbi:tRNA uridine-5-carboxymethylaminomethyl(34) synthesis GTPase MnmE [Rhodopila sp.]|uniref:tRNA uridine-5-carboxymethylaminomethyl(34) synthesis GTPase MnmE n=1 Tax=Rhodopila sp. TaxID=2480087 RepID=UPI003D0C5683
MWSDTIFALASGSARAAIAVLRLSGPATGPAVAALCGGVLPAPRRASVRRLRQPSGGLLDHAVVLWFPGPDSYTGEDCAELQLHGGRAVIDGVAGALIEAGLRPAEAGEFTRRGFLNGRMDLVEAEAVHDLVAAETEAQRRQALRQLEGALGALYQDWADRLRGLLAYQEALIDFPDEDLPAEVEQQVLTTLRAVCGEIRQHLNDAGRGEKLREGLFFAITGAPNVGKSTLINALAEREVAIVSDIPGTTRDALETRVVLGGVPVTLVDTAGLREAGDSIEAEGVRRALARARDADLVMTVVEAGSGPPAAPPPGGPGGLLPAGAGHLLIANKADLRRGGPPDALRISAMTGLGMADLRVRLADAARGMTESSGPPPLTQARHRAALLRAADHLDASERADLAELRGEDLRLAMRALGRITGHVGVEDVLDTVFSRFCIGK